MANTSGINNQSVPRKDERQSAECPPDSKLPENSQDNLDARLDHAIEETFPTSDPVSVTITKGPAPEPPDHLTGLSAPDDQPTQPEQNSPENILDHVRGAMNDVSEQAAGVAREVYSRGERYVRQVGDQYPEAERYVRAGQRVVTHPLTGNPLLALFMAGAAGYVLAWLIHGSKRDQQPDVPDHARTSRGYTAHHGL